MADYYNHLAELEWSYANGEKQWYQEIVDIKLGVKPNIIRDSKNPGVIVKVWYKQKDES